MLFWQILIDGFAISSLYALGATGFALIFGVSGVLNLSHGALMVAAVVAAWAAGNDLHVGPYAGAMIGVAVGFVASMITYFVVVRPLQRSRKIREDEKEIFILTATLLWGIMLQELIAYFYTNNAKTVAPIVEGVVRIVGVRTPSNEIFTAVVCWLVIGILWLLVNRTRAGKAVLGASMNPRGVTLLGVELSQVYIAVWAIYGVLVGVAGVLLGMFLGVSSYSVGPLTASAFSIVVLGGLTAVALASFLPLGVSGYILGLLTIAYYFGVFAMAWDLLFGFAGEVNFGPTFLIGTGAYTAGILDNLYQPPIWLCVAAGALAAVAGGVVLALPALRVRGPYFGLTTLVAVLMLQNFVVVDAPLTGGEIGLTVPDVITISDVVN